jgi:hypothetical protein
MLSSESQAIAAINVALENARQMARGRVESSAPAWREIEAEIRQHLPALEALARRGRLTPGGTEVLRHAIGSFVAYENAAAGGAR